MTSRSIKSNSDLRLRAICLFKLRARRESALAFMGLHYGNSLPWLKHGKTRPRLLILGPRATLMYATKRKCCTANKQEKARRRGKQIRDGLKGRGRLRGGGSAYLRTQFKFSFGPGLCDGTRWMPRQK